MCDELNGPAGPLDRRYPFEVLVITHITYKTPTG